MRNIAKIGVGVDVSKAILDVYIYPEGKSFSVENTKQGIKKLIQKLEKYELVYVGCEVTGSYENILVQMLRGQTNIRLFRFNPRRVVNFKILMGKEAKTDKIDAFAIAKMVVQEDISRCMSAAPDLEQEGLKKLSAQRRHFKQQLASTRTYSQAPLVLEDSRYAERMIKALERIINDLTKRIDKIISNNAEMQEKIELITSIRGCGIETAMAVLSYVPEAGDIDHKALCSLLGLAPFSRESGTWVGKRYTRFGRYEMREILYMAALTASRYNPVLKLFYDRLVAKGKAKKVALIAVARRLACIINAILRNKTPWRDTSAAN